MILQLHEIQSPNTLARQFGDQQNDSQQKTELADAIDDKRLICGDPIGSFLIPKTDQQERTKTDAFPSDKKQQQVVAHYQEQHEKDEKIQVNKKPHHVLVMLHVAQRIEVNEKADAGYDQKHYRGQCIDLKRDLHAQRS